MLKLQYFGHLMQRANSLEKTLMLRKIEGRRRRGQQKKAEEQPSLHVKPPNGPGIGCPRYFWKLGGWGGLKTGKLFENLFKKQSDSRLSPHLVEK